MSHRLQVLIPEALAAQIRKAAQRDHVSTGEWVRRALGQALEQQNGEGDPLRRLAGLNGPTADIKTMLAEIEAGRQQ